MSKLRKQLYKMAEDFQMTSDGQYINPETGEVTHTPPVNKDNQSWNGKVNDLMKSEKSNAQSDYLDNKYYNQWGKVSPFNIIMVDSMNSLYSMDPRSASDSIITIIESLNKAYPNDDTYDYVSQSYMNELKMNLGKKKTIDKVIEYMTNIYFKGIGMGSSTKRQASLSNIEENVLSFDINLNDKKALNRIIIAFTTYMNAINK